MGTRVGCGCVRLGRNVFKADGLLVLIAVGIRVGRTVLKTDGLNVGFPVFGVTEGASVGVTHKVGVSQVHWHLQFPFPSVICIVLCVLIL